MARPSLPDAGVLSYVVLAVLTIAHQRPDAGFQDMSDLGRVKSMFGKEQLNSLADFVQGSLMLRYNKRNVG